MRRMPEMLRHLKSNSALCDSKSRVTIQHAPVTPRIYKKRFIQSERAETWKSISVSCPDDMLEIKNVPDTF